MNIAEQVQDIFREEFENDSLQISGDMNSSHIRGWDSLANINLIIAMEKTFKIKFVTTEIQKLTNIGDMISLIEQKLSEK